MMKKYFLYITLTAAFLTPAIVSAATYYVAPSGSNSNPGTQAQPFATLQKAHDVAAAGDTIYLRDGVYNVTAQQNLTKSGTSGSRIKVFNYPGEVPILDGSGITGTDGTRILRVDGSWWHIKGLELRNNPRGGGFTINGSNNIIENNNIHHNGILSGCCAGGIIISSSNANNNLILNNDAHHNRDATAGNADGIQVSPGGSNNVLRGNRLWRNSDDGFDFFFNKTGVLVENNWAWENGFDDNLQALGNGNGFKLGGREPGDGGHMLKNNLAWKNRREGFDQNNADLPITLYNNTAWNNPSGNYVFSVNNNIFRNNISFGNLGQTAGSATFNSWNLPVTVTTADFQSLDFSCALSPRQADGSLPNCPFLRLVSGSDMIDAGTNVGIPYSGSAPDLGAFEFGGAITPPPPPPPPPPIDTTVPTVSITSPTSGAIVSGTAVTVSASASDNVGVVGVQFKLDGMNLGAEDTASPYSIVWNTTGTTNASHTLTAIARDAAGNMQTSSAVAVTVNNTSTTCTTTALNVSTATNDGGYAWIVVGTFGTPADIALTGPDSTRSLLRLFENGVEVGPAHTLHVDIRNIGLGRFSHWSQPNGTGESIRLSASNNSDPRTNGRSYTYAIGCTPTIDTISPSVPTNLLATAISSSEIALSWTPSTDNVAVTGYKVYRGGTQIASVTGTSHTDTGLLPSTVYSYTVSAIDAAGNESVQSNSVSAFINVPNVLAIGDRVATTAKLNVRFCPAPSCPKLGMQEVGAQGTIVGGPALFSDHTWWNINYDVGADGWSIADYLVEVSTSTFSLGSAYLEQKLARQLDIGTTGADVSALQQFLASYDHVYPEKLITGYFGNLTANAVSVFQSLHGIPSVGRVGPITLRKLNEFLKGL